MSSPYSTGGGGVRLEHRYAATLLARLLSGDPIFELGDAVTPTRVHLQASALSPVDDVVIDGRADDGSLHRVAVGVRRDPHMTAGDTASVPLVRAFLRVVTDNWSDVEEGRLHTALVTATHRAAVAQTADLATIAQSETSAEAFREAVARPGRTNGRVRERLRNLDALVAAAATGDDALETEAASDLTWRWLSSVRIRQLRLEDVDESDRTAAVAVLRQVVTDGSATAADAVFAALAESAGGWASSGATIDRGLLRRTLSGHRLRRSPTYAQAWSVLDGLGRRLREGVPPDVSDEDVRLELDRSDERTRLVAAMANTGTIGGSLVVTGEPDVGKSALALRAAEQLASEGATVLRLSLRDLPSTMLELEHVLASSVAEVMSEAEVSEVRLLVVDGAEAVLEGRRDVFREFVVAASQAGFGVVAVTRSDGSTRVKDVLAAAWPSASGARASETLVVGRLTAPERQALVDTFPSLRRLTAEARMDWLVGRPGLIDVLLRAGSGVDAASLLSEADVFVAVWNSLIRNHEERLSDGTTGLDREHVTLMLAREALGLPGGPRTGAAWTGLRSDGVLRAAANPALSQGDQFASDLMRDFALCRLFLVEGWGPLRAAGAPRWAIRAVRLACQAKLMTDDAAAPWSEIRTAFADVATVEGERWSEVPIEALLTLGDAQRAIEEVWDDLELNNSAGLKTLLRLAQQRYVSGGNFGDPFALAPIVAVSFCSERQLGQHNRYVRPAQVGGMIRELVLAWLRGMAQDDRSPDLLRQQVRDAILAYDSEHDDEFTVEALATLGQDADAASERWLLELAARHPDRLEPAVESLGAILSLSASKPTLLLTLAEAYYLERDEPDDWHGGLLDDGIRDHKHVGGFETPSAAWYYGPFFRLLNTKPLESLAFVNRMLDHAAQKAAQRPRRRSWEAPTARDEQGEDGLELDLPGIGRHRYIGDGNTWGWYRGSTTGPYPCMSALLAVEKFADHLVDTLGLPIGHVSQVLLRGCNNLAMPGLVMGLLTRHFESAGVLLDPYLVNPAVWSLEFSRTSGEGRLHVQGRDSADLHGRERRTQTPRDTAAEMTVRAMEARDQSRLDALAAIGDALLTNARAEIATDPDVAEQLLVVEGWASAFRPENYRRYRTPDGRVVVQYEHPEPIAEAFAATTEKFKTGSEAMRLQLTYSERNDSAGGWPVETLIEDIAFARRLAVEPSEFGPLHPEDPVAAVAAAAIVSHAGGQLVVSDDGLRWAAAAVIDVATNPRIDQFSYASTTYPMGADRAAARAVPSLLLPAFDHLALDTHSVEAALLALVSSMFDEVRTAFVAGCEPLWETPCSNSSSGACSRHRGAWAAVQAALGDCRREPQNDLEQELDPQSLDPPYLQTLPSVPSDDLLINRLAMPIGCCTAARSATCLNSEAGSLLTVLLDAHRRGFDHWMRKGYSGNNNAEHELVARILIDLTLEGEPAALEQHLRLFASNPQALHDLLHDFALLSTYDSTLRPSLATIWPFLLATILDAIDAGADLKGSGRWVDYALASLLPTPQLRSGDPDPDSSLEQARSNWLDPQLLAGDIDRWIALAAGEPKAADAVAKFARTGLESWQRDTGLTWLERVIDGRYDLVASRVWFVTHWLAELRESGALDSERLSQWRRIVDGLAAAGDERAVELQRIDE
jgi:hypothetical protein